MQKHQTRTFQRRFGFEFFGVVVRRVFRLLYCAVREGDGFSGADAAGDGDTLACKGRKGILLHRIPEVHFQGQDPGCEHIFPVDLLSLILYIMIRYTKTGN